MTATVEITNQEHAQGHPLDGSFSITRPLDLYSRGIVVPAWTQAEVPPDITATEVVFDFFTNFWEANGFAVGTTPRHNIIDLPGEQPDHVVRLSSGYAGLDDAQLEERQAKLAVYREARENREKLGILPKLEHDRRKEELAKLLAGVPPLSSQGLETFAVFVVQKSLDEARQDHRLPRHNQAALLVSRNYPLGNEVRTYKIRSSMGEMGGYVNTEAGPSTYAFVEGLRVDPPSVIRKKDVRYPMNGYQRVIITPERIRRVLSASLGKDLV